MYFFMSAIYSVVKRHFVDVFPHAFLLHTLSRKTGEAGKIGLLKKKDDSLRGECAREILYIRRQLQTCISYYSIHSHFKILSMTNSLVCKRKYVAYPGWKRVDERGWVSRSPAKSLSEIAPASRARNFTEERSRLRVFHLRGEIDVRYLLRVAQNRVFALKL